MQSWVEDLDQSMLERHSAETGLEGEHVGFP